MCGLGFVSTGASKHTAEYSKYSRNIMDNNGNGGLNRGTRINGVLSKW